MFAIGDYGDVYEYWEKGLFKNINVFVVWYLGD